MSGSYALYFTRSETKHIFGESKALLSANLFIFSRRERVNLSLICEFSNFQKIIGFQQFQDVFLNTPSHFDFFLKLPPPPPAHFSGPERILDHREFMRIQTFLTQMHFKRF